jgi:hypothetical protein
MYIWPGMTLWLPNFLYGAAEARDLLRRAARAERDATRDGLLLAH